MASIAAIASGSDDFNILLAAIGFVDSEIPSAQLAVTLDTAADLTVFAPTDAAFTQLAVDLGFDGDTADETDVATFLVTTLDAQTLLDTILYHVSAGVQSAADVEAADSVATLNGAVISPEGDTLGDLEPDLIDAAIVTPDVAADNGVIHIIDKVMLPFDLPGNDAATITGIVASSGTFDSNGEDFDILLNAVLAADLQDALDDPNADLTAFAPNDAAFLGLAQTLGFTGTDEADAFAFIVDALTLLSGGESPIPLLTDILLYHVAPTSLQSSQVLGASSIETLLGVDLGVSGANLVDGDPDLPDPGIVAVDIQAANGIVHVIDGVLIPVDILPSDGTGVVDFVIGDDTGEEIKTARDNDLVSGKDGDDNVFLGKGDDLALGGDGEDTIRGGQGDDTVDGGDDDDLIVGRDGNDMLSGGDGDDVINGAQNSDMLMGDAGDDLLRGGNGSDMVDGGDGDDTMKGGSGEDEFYFTAGEDRILDFEVGSDMLKISMDLLSDVGDLGDFAEDDEGNLVLTFGDDTELWIKNVTLAEIEGSVDLF